MPVRRGVSDPKLTVLSLGYIGRTVRPLHERVAEHRANFYKLLNDPTLKFSYEYLGEENDTYNLGGHLLI